MARTKLLLLGAVALGAAAFLKRDKVTALLPSRSETPTYTPPATGPSNYDASGPVANTATAVPVPEAYEPPTVDEAEEEAGNPLAGEQLEERPTEPTGWEPPSAAAAADEPAPFEPKDSEEKPDDDEKEREPIDWSTWSGRSIDP